MNTQKSSTNVLGECPYCTEALFIDQVHICPVGCCFVPGYQGEESLVCLYCELGFEVINGHVCLELIRLTEPAQ